MMMSSSQNKGLHDNYSTPPTKDPQEGKTEAVIAVMRGNPRMVATTTIVTSTISKN
jgi:hypothetical protein